jgi:hypothetical protein
VLFRCAGIARNDSRARSEDVSCCRVRIERLPGLLRTRLFSRLVGCLLAAGCNAQRDKAEQSDCMIGRCSTAPKPC